MYMKKIMVFFLLCACDTSAIESFNKKTENADLNPAISKFSYSIDISSFESFKI